MEIEQSAAVGEESGGKSMNLMFCLNQKALGLLSTCLKSILRSGGYAQYHVYLLHSDLDDSMTRAMERDFREHVTFHFLKVPQTMFADFPETDRYPKQIYYRLAAPLLLPEELERILYLDVDMVVIHSLQELYETDFEGNYYVGCTHTREFLTKLNQARLKSEKAVAYLNTGVLLLNLPLLRQNTSLEEIRDYADQRRRALILPDQDILAALYGDKVKLVDTMRYNLSDRILAVYNAEHPREKRDVNWVRENGVVIHYCGRNKPWNDDYTGTLGVFYRELTEKALEK